MSHPPFDAEAYMAAAAQALGITLDEAWKPGVIDNLNRAHAIAQAFLDFPLPDDVEPASRFES
ncbi:DUF4089 domain-containing protein [Ferrovibrio sp.]|uniref:DUF4089 domain-containing protein n=1 Tax=Ferrovibrio sp. TaxID=1917215 RepID=UPI002623FB9C|nr:DUF4089 domain-containing protein [Ferrovibrio sp.]